VEPDGPEGPASEPEAEVDPEAAASPEVVAEAVVAEAGSEAIVAEGSIADAGSEAVVAEAGPEAPPEPPVAPRHRHPFYLRGRHIRLPRSRAGLVALLLILAAGGSVVAFTGVSMIQWTESADFCGRCHTMTPELQAHAAGAHKDVSCGECHVEPGIAGWIKAKINGTRQLVDVVMGTYPTPIMPPDHAEMPKAVDTCQKCHSLTQRSFVSLRTDTQFAEDLANSRQFVGLMIRPGGGDAFNVSRSVHWHVLSTFSYLSPDENSQVIDYVTATRNDGTTVEYIAQNKISVAENVQPDIDALKAKDRSVVLSCYDCHNRVGHDVLNPRTALDYQLSTGVVDSSLPYIKREGMRILWNGYPDEAAANAAADNLADFYKNQFPDVYATKGAQIATAIDQIKVIYRLSATPDMQVTAKTYPNNMGHLDWPGCFRCHDGGHYQVVNGAATKKVIPSACNTCHTFPQIGPAVASMPLGEPPSTHASDPLWVFNHKSVATDVDPGRQTCGECHARDYCVNCHSTGAVTVNHETMSTNHAAIIRAQGNTSCAYCHQPVFCARCHNVPVLPVTTPNSQGPGSPVVPGSSGAPPGTQGVSWPLKPRG
jgi:nitrate/TMAO reductase-like tetraheme cytochrome c subunit